MRKMLEIGGFVAAAVLIAFGIVAIAMGVNGRDTVGSSLKQEAIVGSPDMTPTLIRQEATKAGLPSTLSIPSLSVAGKPIDSGARARAFAGYMRIHALEATGGLTYAQMPRYGSADGKGTNDQVKAVQVDGRPVDNAARTIWVTETALATALEASYMAEQISLFAIVVGIALLLSGIGFAILALGGTLRGAEPAFKVFGRRATKVVGPPAVPTA